jgi:hypothetical protein
MSTTELSSTFGDFVADVFSIGAENGDFPRSSRPVGCVAKPEVGEMKALSLKQPWAELVVQGRKTIETRKWNTAFRGEFLVHASGNTDAKAMQKFGFKELPQQMIVGRAMLIEVKVYKDRAEWDADDSKNFAKEWWDGKKRYGYVLQNVKRLTPKPCEGKLNFFEVQWEKPMT